MKKIIKSILYILLLAAIAFGFLLVYGTISDYKPAPQILVYTGSTPDILPDSSELNLMIWNIGYAGLSSDMDFFYDGVKKVFPNQTESKANFKGIENYLSSNKSVDVFMLQEVDQSSRRSHFINQYREISELMPTYIPTFGINYNVFFVPMPLTKPMGTVLSGVATYSKFIPENSVRYSFPGNYDWPTNVFMLDRCFLVNRYKVSNGKELLLINTHNSAYDNGNLRQQQMAYLKEFLVTEYKKGNYIVVGGDWNQSPAGFKPDFKNNIMDNENRMDISSDFLADWNWTFDNTTPTNRRVVAPYDIKTTLTTVIDFYLLSPNIEKIAIKNQALEFKYSDHNPVKIKIKFKH